MSDYPQIPPDGQPLFIHAWTQYSLGFEFRQSVGVMTPASANWTANQAVFIPFAIPWPYIVRRMFWINGSVASSNVNVGIYSEGGARICSTGSVGQSGASVVQYAAPTTPVLLQPGRYYFAFICDGTTNRYMGVAGTAAQGKIIGLLTQAVGSITLPAAATFATYAGVGLPVVGFTKLASGF